MIQFWDERYSTSEYVYGKQPNTFFKTHLAKLKPGKILLPGEGEGRNAVYAATMAWSVNAFDPSREGKKKALLLASENKVTLDYTISSYLDYNYKEGYFDAIGLFFTHQPSTMRILFHNKLRKALKPGGLIILEAFHKKQIHRNTGGPGNLDLLFSKDDLLGDFDGFDIQKINVVTRKLEEGLFHQGEAVVIQMLAKKLTN